MIRRIILKTASNDSYYDGDCQYAIVDVTPETLDRLLHLIREAQTTKKKIEALYHITLWDSTATYSQGPDDWADIYGEEFAHLLESRGWALEPEMMAPPQYEAARTECDQLEVTPDALWWTTYPKHTDITVATNRLSDKDLRMLLRELRGRPAPPESTPYNISKDALGINSMGEVFVKGTCVLSDVNLTDLTERLGHAPSNQDVSNEFDRQARQHLAAAQYAAYVHHVQLMRLGSDVVRFYTNIKRGLRSHWLSLEFLAFSENDALWTLIEEFAMDIGARINDMDEREHLDHSWRTDAKTGEVIEETYGPNHGRMERQVTVDLDITRMPVDEVRALRDAILDIAQEKGVSACLVSVI